MDLHVNMIAILVAVVVNFVIGFIWYTPLFGKAWGKEMGYDPNVPADKSLLMKGMAFMVIGNLLFAYVLAYNIAAWQYAPGVKEMGTMSNTFSTAIFTWLGFYVPGELGAIAWEKHSWKLFAINTGYQLVSLFVVALILISWP